MSAVLIGILPNRPSPLTVRIGTLSAEAPSAAQLGNGWSPTMVAILHYPVTDGGAVADACANAWISYGGRIQGSVFVQYGRVSGPMWASLSERVGQAPTASIRKMRAILRRPIDAAACGAGSDGRRLFRTNALLNTLCDLDAGPEVIPPSIDRATLIADDGVDFKGGGTEYCYAVLRRQQFAILTIAGDLPERVLVAAASSAVSDL